MIHASSRVQLTGVLEKPLGSYRQIGRRKFEYLLNFPVLVGDELVWCWAFEPLSTMVDQLGVGRSVYVEGELKTLPHTVREDHFKTIDLLQVRVTEVIALPGSPANEAEDDGRIQGMERGCQDLPAST